MDQSGNRKANAGTEGLKVLRSKKKAGQRWSTGRPEREALPRSRAESAIPSRF